MPNSILWIGLVVLWIFVVFPMLTSRHPRIRQHTDAALSTRVLHRGDAKPLARKGPATGHETDPDYVPVRRKHHHSDDPEDRMTRSDDSTTAGSDDEDFDTDRERDSAKAPSATAVTEPSGDAAETAASEQDPADNDLDVADQEHPRAENEHETAESEDVAAEFDDRDEYAGERASETSDESGYDDAEPRPRGRADTMRTRDETARSRVPALRDEDLDREADESDSEDSDFVPSRRGRGGYDPEADAIARAARYTFRQRAVLGLLLTTLALAAAGVAVSSGLWGLAGLSGAVLVAYLAYLRRQVRIEEDIRRRRMSRLGGRTRDHDEEEEFDREPERPRPDRDTTRSQLRRAVLVEPDDEDPVFENLELFDAATARAVRARASGNRVRHAAVGE
ncbi:gephyrin-like molybdotransferase receptor GlpR [Nocardia sp. NPDC057668]|uniref:divisome protein SepX/GlpR n=1 Tax=Nocardia sp. NPDC057668 TaxID=3346202 RepID=UPI0036722772